MQKKGIVMQITDGQAICMTNDCEFRKIPYLEGMAVGQEVEVPLQTTQTVHKKPLSWFGTPLRKTGVLAASVLLAFGVWGSQSLFSQQTAYAYVTVDINPSVELSIDNHKSVLDVTALNDDAEQVLTDLNVKGLSLDKAVESIAEVAKNKGYFRENSEVIITASPAVSNDKLASEHFDLDQIETDLVTQVKTAVTTTGTHVDVEGIRVSPQVREAAQKAGLSPGKYAVYLTAQSNGINVSVEELKQHSITTVISNHGQALEALVQKLTGGQQLDQLMEAFNKDGGKTNPQQPAVLTPNGTQTTDKGHSQQPPGQQKKDGASKQDPSAEKDKGNPKDNNSSDREHSDQGNKGNSGHDGKHKDDGESDRGNQGGKDKKGNDNQNGNGSQNAGNFASEVWQWIQTHDGLSRNDKQDDKQKHGQQQEQKGHGEGH